jgi:thiosulfate reductase cytochrome b subunit
MASSGTPGIGKRLRPLLWFGPLAIVALGGMVLIAIVLRDQPAIQDFLTTYPGETALPETAPVGIPAWLGWQHFLNAFFLVLIVRTGWQIRTTTRPAAYWTRKRTRVSLNVWLHLVVDLLWVANGALFIVLLFVSGHWMRIVPTSWDVIPNAVSVAIQYASLDWPIENGWVNYNSLQLLSYFVTVFIAAPLAILTGIRMSPLWERRLSRLDRIYPVAIARAVHFPVMLYFLLFTLAHVTLVLATGALRNLNHMYAARDDGSWLGFGIFAVSLVVTIAGWLLAKPIFVQPLAALFGTVTKGR